MRVNFRVVFPLVLLSAALSLASPSCLYARAGNPSSSAAQAPQNTSPAAEPELAFVVILTRHGVRSPTATAARLDQYSAQPWPAWGVPPGDLTEHGKILMRLFGAYDRAYLAHDGLLDSAGCSDASRVFIWADTDERTLETGRALAAGMLPGCGAEIHSLPKGQHDPIFHPFRAGVKTPDPRIAFAAVSGRIGGNPSALDELYRPALEMMERVLLDCQPGKQCPPAGHTAKKSLFDVPTSLMPGKGDNPADMRGTLDTASSLSEDFLLEYTDGMEGRELGWGRLNASNLREMMNLHGVYADLMRQTPYIARARASNLLSHILESMQQAATHRPVPGAMGKPGDLVLVLVGHDTNISNVAGALGLSWLIRGYQRDATPPGGALVFELWRGPATGKYTVRTYYTSQTLDQMSDTLPLTLHSPPARAPVFVPGCGTAQEGLACGWEKFQRVVQAAVEPAFVKP